MDCTRSLASTLPPNETTAPVRRKWRPVAASSPGSETAPRRLLAQGMRWLAATLKLPEFERVDEDRHAVLAAGFQYHRPLRRSVADTPATPLS